MRKKSTITMFGVLTIILGLGMFVFGASMFTYKGPLISAFVSKAGEYSFFLWLPTLIAGIPVLVIGIKIKKRPLHTDI